MGRTNSSSSVPQNETKTYHFSHQHPLNLTNYHQQTLTSSSCSGCNLNLSGMIYSCTSCNFYLHKKCFDMPKRITHPYKHKDHALTLKPKPDNPDKLFKCDACGDKGHGFSYNCKPCGVDLHVLCAAMPLSVTHGFHGHKLDLTFESPYETKDFVCNICRKHGSDHWLYRCNICDFDAHLNCARTHVQPNPISNFAGTGTTSSRSVLQQPQAILQPQFVQPMQPNLIYNPSAVGVPTGFANLIYNPSAVGVPTGFGPYNMGPFGVYGQNNEMAMQAIMQMVQNNNAMTQAILARGGVGGGGMQQMMQLLSGFNGGVGGGGMQQMMQLLSGLNGGDISGLFGGNSLDLLGGGGFDFLGGFF